MGKSRVEGEGSGRGGEGMEGGGEGEGSGGEGEGEGEGRGGEVELTQGSESCLLEYATHIICCSLKPECKLLDVANVDLGNTNIAVHSCRDPRRAAL